MPDHPKSNSATWVKTYR